MSSEEVRETEEISKDMLTFGKRVEIIRIWADEFCSKSSVHGIRYITEKGRHWTEILWWIFAFGLSVCLCTYSIQHLWKEWNDNPIVVSFDDKQSSVDTVPFPAVTVCPATKVMFNSLNFTEAVQLSSLKSESGVTVDDISNKLKAALQICSTSTPYYDVMIGDHENFTDASIYQTLGSLNANANRTVFDARWLKASCDDCFQPIYTNNGLCLTFNMLNSLELYTNKVVPDLLSVNYTFNATHWSMEKGYDSHNQNDSLYPFRVCAGGTYASLTFDSLFDINDWDEHCDGPNQEFYISLHPPDELPKMWNNFIRIPAKHEVSISIEPKVMKTLKNLKSSYSSQKRECFFVSERRLKFFKKYNQVNCEVECLAKFTKLKCKCVPFYLPRDNDTKICSMGTYDCYKQASEDFYEPNPIKYDPLVANLYKECNCLPTCNSIHYDLHVSQIKGRISNYDRPLVASRLQIYFKNSYYIAMIRRERFNIAEFLANCGGLFGLFMGASLLSFIELIYYCSLRLMHSLSTRSSNQSDFPM